MDKRLLTLIGLLSILMLFPDGASAQRRKKKVANRPKTIYEIDTLINPIPLQRRTFHDVIVKDLRGADASDGAVDKFIWFGDDTLASQVLTQAMLVEAAHLDTMIENLPFTDKQTENQTKIRYLKAVHNLFLRYNRDAHVDPYFYRKVVTNERELLVARHENRLLDYVKANANIYTLANVELLDGFPEARAYAYKEVGLQNPQKMIHRLSEFANEPFADDIIAAAAKVVPKQVYTYAASTNYTLSGAIRRTKDPLVQTIVRIATESKNPLKAISFVNDIFTQKLSIADVDKITGDDALLYKNLVRLKLEQQQLGGDTYTDELGHRGLLIVREMNRLHDAKDPVRFKIVDSSTPEELYFLLVYGVDEIYTSTFTGTFNRMMQRLSPAKGNELLDRVHLEHFRTFIRMSAGYGKLSEFLATVDSNKKTELMKGFISGLEKGKDDDLEDAVDVADAFGSIEDTTLATFLQNEVRMNYERVGADKNKKGTIIYGLMSILFNGMRTGQIDAGSLQIPPVSFVPYKKLLGDTTVVFEQFYFYGDEDGNASYNSFLTNFKDPKVWKTEIKTKSWIKISSVSGKPVVVFANLPVPGEDEDQKAQDELNKYLSDNHIQPTIIVHRGHSYHLSSTLERINKKTKVCMLGSCGGYHNLGTILSSSPDAHIISTKQVGSMSVNEPIIKEMNRQLLEGTDLDWIIAWRNLNVYFDKLGGEPKDKFKDYVPPHRNLGAIFIKAYRRILNTSEAEAGD